MDIDRRQLALPVLASDSWARAAFAAAGDEDAVAKNVEAFRAAQFALDAKALDALCAAELSYSPLRWPGRGQGDLHRQRHRHRQSKTKTLSLAYETPN